MTEASSSAPSMVVATKTSAPDEFADRRMTDTTTGTAVTTTRRRNSALRALAVLAVAVPLAACAVTSREGNPPSALVASNGPAVVDSGAPGEPSPTDSPSVSAAPAPNGELTIQDLTSTKVTVAKWTGEFAGCASGSQRLVAKGAPIDDPMMPVLDEVVHTNLDDDPQLETAALIRCQYGEASGEQLIAFDRGADGSIVELGEIVQGHIWSVTARAAGGVTIDISDSQSCCDEAKLRELHQTRSYAWTGSRIAQVSGPTSFLPHSGKITLAATATATWGPASGNERTGTVKIRITNKSSARSGSILVMDNSGQTSGEKVNPGAKIVPGLASGATTTVTLTVTLDAENTTQADAEVLVYELGSDTVGQLGTLIPEPLWQ